MLLILIVGVSCLFICLQFFAAVVVDVLIKESCVEWNSFKQEEKKSVQYRAVFLGFLNSKYHHPKGKSIFQKKRYDRFSIYFPFEFGLDWCKS